MCSTSLETVSHLKLKLDRSSGNDLAEIIKCHLDDYRRHHKLSAHQYRVLSAIRSCRTGDLGAHLQKCDHCDYRQIAYNSCGNRHCPKCQGNRRRAWLNRQLKDMLPIPYYHVVFTLPHQLNELCLYNKRVIYDLFFDCAVSTLQRFAEDPKHLGGRLGIIALLHTWGQNLSYHVHLHLIVTAGGLCEAEACWKPLPYRRRFLFPVKALSVVMRAKFLQGLARLYSQGELNLNSQGCRAFVWPPNFKAFMNQMWQSNFYSYAKKPFAGSESMFKYLADYTNRVAISNQRIQSVKESKVSFTYKDYRDGHKRKSMTLSATEFLRRFLHHILPPKFRKIRYYGILAPGCRAKYIDLISKQLAVKVGRLEKNSDLDHNLCPKCHKGGLKVTRHYSAAGLAALLFELENQLSLNFDSS